MQGLEGILTIGPSSYQIGLQKRVLSDERTCLLLSESLRFTYLRRT